MTDTKRPNRYDTQQNMVTAGTAPLVPTVVRPMSQTESELLQGLTQTAIQPAPPVAIPTLPPATHTAHMRDNFDVRAAARVAERFILWGMGIFGAITAALAGLIYYRVGGDSTLYALGWLVVWGSVSYLAMNRNRAQSYDHSPTGVARLEQCTQERIARRHAQTQEYQIDANERIAMHAIDRHVELVKTRWQLEAGQAGGTTKQLGVNRE